MVDMNTLRQGQAGDRQCFSLSFQNLCGAGGSWGQKQFSGITSTLWGAGKGAELSCFRPEEGNQKTSTHPSQHRDPCTHSGQVKHPSNLSCSPCMASVCWWYPKPSWHCGDGRARCWQWQNTPSSSPRLCLRLSVCKELILRWIFKYSKLLLPSDTKMSPLIAKSNTNKKILDKYLSDVWF